MTQTVTIPGGSRYRQYMLENVPVAHISWGLRALIRSHMRAAGITQRQAAEAIGKSQAAVSKWFRGEGEWALDEVDRICSAVGLDVTLTVYAVIRPAESKGGEA